MFEDIHEIAENSAYLKAVEERDVSLEMLEQLPAYADCASLEARLQADGLLGFDSVFHSATGYYLFSCFLIADYAQDKAVFLRDVESYRQIRFESARRRIAALLFARFVSLDQQDAADAEAAALAAAAAAAAAGGPASARTAASSPHADGAGQQQPHQPQGASQEAKAGSLTASLLLSGPPALPSGLGSAAHKGRSVFARMNGRGGPHSASVLPAPAASSAPPPTPPPPPPASLLLKPGAATVRPAPAARLTSAQQSDGRLVSVAAAAAASSLSASASATELSQQSVSVSHPAALLSSSASPQQQPDGPLSSSQSALSRPTAASLSAASAAPPLSPAALPVASSASSGGFLCMTQRNNAIGVYGRSVQRVAARVAAGEAPRDLFDEVAREVRWDLRLDAFPRFRQSAFYQRFIRTKSIESVRVQVRDFTTFRVLGRGGFGAVHACRKKNSGSIYAMKAIHKKLVKVKSALDNVLEERNVLTAMRSSFVTNLKYALQDEESLYLIMDLMLGGDLKFHLINAGRFTEKRARFYAAEVLLGLEHLHKMSIVYRDMKLENVLLDDRGHCKISDLGLAVVTKVKIKGYAGTPGYTAPEMIKNKLYGPAADIFSYGVMLYRMLCGSKPFKGKVDRELDKAVLEKKPAFPKEIFSKEAISLLTGLLAKRPEQRLGCGEAGMEEIKEHPFFESIDWGLLESGYSEPPFVPNKFDVNAASLKDIGDFDRTKYRNVKLDDRFRSRTRCFDWLSVAALQEEMVQVLEKADANVVFEKFAARETRQRQRQQHHSESCCAIV